MIRLRNLCKTSGVAVNGFFEFQRHKEGVSLLLKLISHGVVLYSTSFDDQLGIWFSTACSLHHLSLGKRALLLFWLDFIDWNDLVIIIFSVDGFIGKLIPSLIVINERRSISFKLLFLLRDLLDVLFVENVTFLGLHLLLDIDLVSDRWQRYVLPRLSGLR